MLRKTLQPVENKYLWIGATLVDENNITWIIRHIGIRNGVTTYFLVNGEKQITLTRKEIMNYFIYVLNY